MSRILLIAYQCGPGMGSVSQLGWEWYNRLSQRHQLTLVTHSRNQVALQAAGAPLMGSEVIYIDTEWFAGPLYRLSRRLFPGSEHSVFALSSLDYFLFDYLAYRQLKPQAPRWQLLHRVTPVTLAAPTCLGCLPLPLVLGPLNSGLADPPHFQHIMRSESSWFSRAVRILPCALDRLLGASKLACILLVANHTTRNAVPTALQHKCQWMLENGVDLQQFVPQAWPVFPDQTRALNVLFVGRLVAVKGLDMLLRAVAAYPWPIVLSVVGDGPMRAEWQQLANTLAIADRVQFHGTLNASEVAKQMAACHVFCLPSVRESGGAVLLEAMACARPVIALNYGGPADLVNDQVGALLPMHDSTQVTLALLNTLLAIPQHPEQWLQRGQNGRLLVEQRYSWPAKIAHAEDLYRQLIAERNPSCLSALPI